MTLSPPRPTGDTRDTEGYAHTLGNRQIQMIAIGGAIGVGLFLGAGGLLERTGPALIVAYTLTGIAAFFVMRALGELVLYRPTGGSFVEYAREFIGPWAGFASGWMYWLNWAMTGIAEITAVGLYCKHWFGDDFPQWVGALIGLGIVLVANAVSVKAFGELEFWFALGKVAAIVAFLLVGVYLVATTANVGDSSAGVSNLTAHDGFFPSGLGVVILSINAVIFAYSAIELVGITAGEAAEPRKVIPRAINGVVWRIAIFYIGSVALLAMVMPWTSYHAGESPFVTVFSALGFGWAGDVMNLVVLTAALSSCNSGLYSTGRILRSLAQRGEAPAFMNHLSKNHVPIWGIAFTAVVYFAGVFANYLVPERVFEIVIAIASLGVLSTWAVLLYSQIVLRRRALAGELERPTFHMPGSPYTNWGTLAFLLLVLVLMPFANTEQRFAVAALPVVAFGLFIGWRAVQRRRASTMGPASH